MFLLIGYCRCLCQTNNSGAVICLIALFSQLLYTPMPFESDRGNDSLASSTGIGTGIGCFTSSRCFECLLLCGAPIRGSATNTDLEHSSAIWGPRAIVISEFLPFIGMSMSPQTPNQAHPRYKSRLGVHDLSSSLHRGTHHPQSLNILIILKGHTGLPITTRVFEV
ncbi:hypothetical protein GGR53DRAFT_370697 [Hypoxylon sp. FL1150]|nr:hypothetical protein GGR53DRAFT_370697 [Hypoxylon sp. FL1150]